MRKWLLVCVMLVLVAVPAIGQQTGSISGKVAMEDGTVLPGVLVEATSNVLPQPRHSTSGASGEFRFPLLPPGAYELTFSMQGMATKKQGAAVVLEQTTHVDVVMSLEAVSEQIEVVAHATLVNTESAELKATMTSEMIEALPVGVWERILDSDAGALVREGTA